MTHALRRLGLVIAAAASALALAVAPGAAAAPAAAASCSDPVGTSPNMPALRITQRNWPLTGGLHMQTDATVNRNFGGVSATTHTYNSYWGIGYTGGVLVILRNGCGDVIGVTEPVKFGVAAKSEFWAPHDRRDYWTRGMPQVVTERTASAEILHMRSSSDRSLADKYNEAAAEACRWWTLLPPSAGPCAFRPI